ncbi:hypothetical protein B0I37DRAFT_329709 [Chaetomium sp. MPI-CAGE-AT-0009]|nr:hypothetical protein B0I37DRAFT_329709 [Chaetomium sp. MPI-CAGE-AT-0009]
MKRAKGLMKRILPLGKDVAGDEDGPPNRLSREMFPTGIKPLCSPEDSTIDIIFVHGLTGSRINTWTARNETEPWPQTLLPSRLTTARILTFGYDASVTDWRGMVSQNRIANHAWNLLTSLATYRENDDTNERPIIFVCHSLGGLVCEDALVTSRQRSERHLQNILHSTRGIIFLGTPHHGAGLARWAELLSRSIGLVKQTNSEIVEVLRRDSEVLARIQDSFHTMVLARNKEGLQPIEISCFYEELPLPGVGLVVPQDSAILPGYIPIGIHGNHMDMTKFTSLDDPGFVAVCGELRRWIKDMSAAAERRRDRSTLLSNSDLNEQPGGVSNQSGDGNRMLNSFGGSQKNIQGSNYESGGGVMNIGGTVTQHFHAEANDPPKAHRIIPLPRNEHVVNRDKIFTRLNTLLPPTSEYQSAALCGLGGSGKTQVALDYAYRRGREDPACSIFWVHADNDTTFAQDYKTIARKLGLDKQDGQELLMAVCERIESGPPWLLVLDNADDLTLFGVGRTCQNISSGKEGESTSLYDYVPKSGNGTVLWTSRDERIVGTLVGPQRGIQVGQMSPAEARGLLETSRNEKISSDEVVDAEKLLEKLQWLPLAISQAGAYLRRTSTSIGEYLSKLSGRKQRWEVLKKTEFDRHRRHNLPNSILETWSISIDRIRRDNEMAYKILHTIAYISNQDIPFEILKAAGLYDDKGDQAEETEEEGNEDRVLEAVTRLKEFSFLGMRREGRGERSYEMHKLVQEATRYGLSVRREPEDEAYFSNAALRIMEKLFPTSSPETWAECEKYIAHALQVGEWVDICERKLEVLGLLDRVSDYFWDRGRWREKEMVDDRVYKLRQEVQGERHPDTLRAMQCLASTYHMQGRYTEAQPMMIKVLALRWEVLGERHPGTLSTMGNLAITYYQQGRYTEAESIQIIVLALYREVLGERHPQTILAMANLGITYYEQGRYTEAEPMGIKVLALRREVLGERHPDTLHAIFNLAWTVWASRGRPDDAISLMDECLQLRCIVLGLEHADTKQADRVLKDWKMGQTIS